MADCVRVSVCYDAYGLCWQLLLLVIDVGVTAKEQDVIIFKRSSFSHARHVFVNLPIFFAFPCLGLPVCLPFCFWFAYMFACLRPAKES